MLQKWTKQTNKAYTHIHTYKQNKQTKQKQNKQTKKKRKEKTQTNKQTNKKDLTFMTADKFICACLWQNFKPEIGPYIRISLEHLIIIHLIIIKELQTHLFGLFNQAYFKTWLQ